MLINQILGDIIDGNRKPDPALIDELIADHSDEGTWHDFKDGLVTKDKDAAALKLKRFVTGFANADGGLLVFGVSESKPRTVSGCTPIGGKPLDEWATRILSAQAPKFGVQPRIYEIKHPNGLVLVVAAARAPQLVSYLDKGIPVYPLRIGESTVSAPDYLISDLVLGRRNNPVFEISPVTNFPSKRTASGRQIPVWHIDVKIDVRNVSLVAAKNVLIGAVFWSSSANPSPPPPDSLKQYLEILPPIPSQTSEWALTWEKSIPLEFPVFSNREVLHAVWFTTCIKGPLFAIYVVADGCAPQWFQVSMDERDISSAQRVYATRPIVAVTVDP